MAIPREPQVPLLKPEDLQKIEDAVFQLAQPQKSDVLFVFGTNRRSWDDIAGLVASDIAPIVLLTGKHGAEAPEKEQPQSHVIADALLSYGIPAERLLLEDVSTNTRDNVIFGKYVLEQHHLFPKSIVFATKAHHTGRCWLTLRKYFPEARLSCFAYIGEYEGVQVKRETWRDHPVSVSRVYGEYLRIKEYEAKGDIL